MSSAQLVGHLVSFTIPCLLLPGTHLTTASPEPTDLTLCDLLQDADEPLVTQLSGDLGSAGEHLDLMNLKVFSIQVHCMILCGSTHLQIKCKTFTLPCMEPGVRLNDPHGSPPAQESL